MPATFPIDPVSLTAVIMAIGAVIVNIITALRNSKKSDRVLEAVIGDPAKIGSGAPVGGLVGKVEEIHTLTNSTMSQVRAELATSDAINKELTTVIQDMKAERDKLLMKVAFETNPKAASAVLSVERLEVAELVVKPPEPKK